MTGRETEKILAAVDADRVVKLESAMVQIPSRTWEEQKLALFLGDYMRDAGLEVTLQAVPFGDSMIGIQPVGVLKGTGGGRSLLLSGHMDYAGLEDADRWAKPPFSGIVEDGYVYGRGSKDEKGGICAAVSAAEALSRAGIKLKGDLIVAPVMGHKTRSVGGGIGARHLMQSGVTADMAIVTENSNLGIATRCVGRVTAKLVFGGAAGGFDTGPGSDLYGHLARLITRLGPSYATVPENDWLVFTPNSNFPDFPMLLYGGVEANSRRVELSVNVRIVPGQTADSVEADLRAVLASIVRGDERTNAHVDIAQPVRYPHEIGVDHDLVQAIATSFERVRGEPPKMGLSPRRGAVADSWFFIESGLTDTTVFGPGSMGPDFPDRPDERIAIKDLVDCARTYALTAAILCQIA